AAWGEGEDALSRGDLSLVHEVEWEGRWWQLGEFLQRKPWVEEEVCVEPNSAEVASEAESLPVHYFASRRQEIAGDFWGALVATIALLVLVFLKVESSLGLVALVAASVIPAFWLILRGRGIWPWYGMFLLAGVASCVVRATGWV